jgi:hypothetical protein
MAPRQPGRSDAAKRALQVLRAAAATTQRNSTLTDTEMVDILRSVTYTYHRRAANASDQKAGDQ